MHSHSLAGLYRDQGDLEQAAAEFAWCLDVYRDLGDRLREGRTLLAMGEMASAAGDTGRARELCSSALHVFEELQAPDAEQARTAVESISGRDATP
ncbi:tetratricopeptide repeat protein [Streptomyces sp. NPDC019990]|uniref:tetratricopeptide repeat protein n=1 Tax=Streptomyces sp. NPDC019990 TaxID=3154693 RepID=UPI0033C44245